MAYKFKIDDMEEEIRLKADSLAQVIKADSIKAEEVKFNKTINDSLDVADKAIVNKMNALDSYEEEKRTATDDPFQNRINAVGGWEALYDAMSDSDKVRMQNHGDSNFNITMWGGHTRIRSF